MLGQAQRQSRPCAEARQTAEGSVSVGRERKGKGQLRWNRETDLCVVVLAVDRVLDHIRKRLAVGLCVPCRHRRGRKEREREDRGWAGKEERPFGGKKGKSGRELVISKDRAVTEPPIEFPSQVNPDDGEISRERWQKMTKPSALKICQSDSIRPGRVMCHGPRRTSRVCRKYLAVVAERNSQAPTRYQRRPEP